MPKLGKNNVMASVTLFYSFFSVYYSANLLGIKQTRLLTIVG